MLVCSLLHEGQSNPSLSRVLVRKDMLRYTFNIILCQQCQETNETPDCMAACPSEAIYVNEGGAVIIDDELCLLCGDCADACPYDAIFYNQEAGMYFKCDLCTEVANSPACVAICPVEALTVRLEPVPGEA